MTQAANRSLDLSRSLGDRCAEITQGESSDEEEVELNDRQEINQASKEEEREEMVEDENKVADMEPVHIVDVSKYSNFDIKNSPHVILYGISRLKESFSLKQPYPSSCRQVHRVDLLLLRLNDL